MTDTKMRRTSGATIKALKLLAPAAMGIGMAGFGTAPAGATSNPGVNSTSITPKPTVKDLGLAEVGEGPTTSSDFSLNPDSSGACDYSGRLCIDWIGAGPYLSYAVINGAAYDYGYAQAYLYLKSPYYGHEYSSVYFSDLPIRRSTSGSFYWSATRSYYSNLGGGTEICVHGRYFSPNEHAYGSDVCTDGT